MNSHSALDNIQIARITPRDAKGLSDHLFALRCVVADREDTYPGIDKWFDRKVISGLAAKERSAYIGYVNGKPSMAGIVKLGTDAKVCHIGLRSDVQQLGLGEMFFSLLALEARRGATSLHLTLPETLWGEKRGFWESFGFTHATIAPKQYRLFDQELSIRSNFTEIWQSVRRKLPKLTNRFSLAGSELGGGVMFSVHPTFTEKIMNGTKTVEIRRRFSANWEKHRAIFYATAPVGALVGEAQIRAVHEKTPAAVWKRFGHLIGCERAYFDRYVLGCEKIFAIELENARPFAVPMFTEALNSYVGEGLRAPQSYVSLNDDSVWSEAVNITVMLQCLHKRIPRSATLPNGTQRSFPFVRQQIPSSTQVGLARPNTQTELF